MNEIEGYTIECPICLEESSIDNFHQITYGIARQEPIRSIIVEEGCKDCLLVEDIRIRRRFFDKRPFVESPTPNRVLYEIVNQEKYIRTRKINWVKKVLQKDPKDLINVHHMTEILLEKEILKDQLTTGDNNKATKKFLEVRRKQGIFEGFMTIPTTLRNTHFTYAIKKNDFYKVINLRLKGVIQISRTHVLPMEKLKELEQQGYAFLTEGKDKNVDAHFFVNRKDKKTPCRTCGKIKPFDEFTYLGRKKDVHRGGGRLTFECVICSKIKRKNKYDNYSPEEYLKHLNNVKAWRKANKDKVREYAHNRYRTPQARANRNVRRRLKDFLKKAKDHHFSKNIGCTKKELVEHLESQFAEGMSWENYGSGENGDHVGSWHIDHKDPISKFKGDYPNHYTNLQPMWGIDNMRKGNKVSTPV